MAQSNARNLANLLGTETTISADDLVADFPLGTKSYSNAASLPAANNAVGAKAFVEETSRLFMWTGQGWYSIAVINDPPSWDSAPNESYILDSNGGNPLTISFSAFDPESLPVTYSYTASDSAQSFVDITQDSSLMTITTKSLNDIIAAGYDSQGGTFDIIFKATDGVNLISTTSSFEISYITGPELIPIDLGSTTTNFALSSSWAGSFSSYGYTVTQTPQLGTLGFSSVGYTMGSGDPAWYYVEFQPTSSGPWGTLGFGLTSTYLSPNHLGSAADHIKEWDNIGGRTQSMLFNTATGEVYYWFDGIYISSYTATAGTYYLCRSDGSSADVQPGHIVTNSSLWTYDPFTLAANQNIVIG